jgi:hypothetical protein
MVEIRTGLAPFGTEFHLIALFCTVAANAGFASAVATKYSNEIKDLEAKIDAAVRQKSF